MSISSAIVSAQGKVANAYTVVSNKGGTLPATQDLSNLPAAINSISSGSVVIPKAEYVQAAATKDGTAVFYPVLLVRGTSAPSSFSYSSVPDTVLNKNGSIAIETLSSGTYTTWAGYAAGYIPSRMSDFALTATITL